MNRSNRILVVDDDSSVRRAFSKILCDAGYVVREATGGNQALQLAMEEPPEIVLLDVKLPDINGVEVCRRLKADNRWRDVFVALCSGEATEAASKVDGLGAGADDYLTKPVNPEELLARIRTLARLRDSVVALRESEQHYRRLIDILPDAVCLIQTDGQILSINPQGLAMLGYKNEADLVARSFMDLVPGEEHDKVKSFFAATKENGFIRNAACTMLRENGQRLLVEWSASVSPGGNGRAAGIVNVFRDVTDRKKAEDRIQQLLEILDQAQDAIIIRDLDSRIEYFNKGAERILGWTAAEVLGKPTRELFVKDHEAFSGAQAELMLNGRWSGEVEAITKTRQPVIFHSRWTLVLGSPDKPARLVSVNTDITERKMAEGLLREREELSQKIIGTARDGFWMLDLDGQLLEVNEAYCRMSGYSREELLTRRISDLDVNEADPAEANRHIQQVIQSGSHLFETRHRGKDGRIFDLEINATYLKSLDRRIFAFMREITDRKRGDNALRASEERFRQLAENIREVFWITDVPKKEMIYVSPGYETIWGRTCKSLYASPGNWGKAIHAEDRARVMKAARTRQASGKYDEIYRIRRPDGTMRWIQDRAFPVFNDSGKPYRVVGIAEDITKRMVAEEALRKSEAIKSAIMRAALDAIITLDQRGMITDVNPAAEKMMGCARSKMIGKELADVMLAPASRQWLRKGMRHSFSGKEGATLGDRKEVLAQRADGSEFPIEFIISRIELEGPPMFTAFIRDLSQLKRTEEQMRLLADAVESTQEFISITNSENRFTFVNRAFLEGYGYKKSQIIGRTPDFLYSTNNSTTLPDEVFRQTMAGGWRGEILNVRKDGSEFPILLSTSLIKNSEGRIIGLIGVGGDITERKRTENELLTLSQRIIEAQEAERRRVSRELHDGVNQILASANIRLLNLQDRVSSLNPATRAIIGRCSQLLVQALEENRRIAHNLHPTDLDYLGLGDACRNLCREIQSRTDLNVKCRITGLSDRLAPAVELNLFRIVQESIGNIEKHARAKNIVISISAGRDALVLKIRDDGRGFSQDRAPRRKKGRTGLGLNNLKERASAIGGFCQIKSEPGQGTEISVKVPQGR